MALFFFVTNLKKDEILKLTGYRNVDEYIKSRRDAIKEVLLRRKIAPVANIRRAKFYALGPELHSVLGEKHSQVMFALKESASLKSLASFTVESQKQVFGKINAMYPYGEMNDETRQRYIEDLDNEFGDQLVNLYESTK